MTTWDAALDDFESTLLEQRSAMERGDAQAISAYAPPPGLGHLPASLAARAQALLREAERLVHDLQTATSSTQRELALLDRMRPEAAVPSYLDRTM